MTTDILRRSPISGHGHRARQLQSANIATRTLLPMHLIPVVLTTRWPWMTTQETDLFGNEITPFTSARERYGVRPTTVWPVDHSLSPTKALLTAIGDAWRGAGLIL